MLVETGLSESYPELLSFLEQFMKIDPDKASEARREIAALLEPFVPRQEERDKLVVQLINAAPETPDEIRSLLLHSPHRLVLTPEHIKQLHDIINKYRKPQGK